MRKIFFLLIVVLASCSKYNQIFLTESESLNEENEMFIFENDTVKIYYLFNDLRGAMSFYIYNKTNKPLYVDWKKSAYISNSMKKNYWENVTTSTSVSTSIEHKSNENVLNILLENGVINSIQATQIVKQERITFIPPEAAIFKSSYSLYSYDHYKFPAEIEKKEEIINGKKVKLFQQDFSKETSPLSFRNFLTFSFTESIEDEFYIDNRFFIKQITHFAQRYLYKIYKKTAKTFYLDTEYWPNEIAPSNSSGYDWIYE